MAKKGRTKVIYKGKFISKQSLLCHLYVKKVKKHMSNWFNWSQIFYHFRQEKPLEGHHINLPLGLTYLLLDICLKNYKKLCQIN